MNARTALLGLFVALTIVLASTTVYESGARSPPTSTLTVTQTTTLLASATLSSSTFLGVSSLVSNYSDDLSLSVQVEPRLNESYTFTVRVSNLLNTVNNVTGVDGWAYPPDSLSPCGPVLWGDTVELGVIQGRYGGNNYTSGNALPLYGGGSCG